ncbi:serine/threonine-protein phosphatase 4 regulatory subunit 2, partial [Phenoliferia sp. Uapishka_3]
MVKFKLLEATKSFLGDGPPWPTGIDKPLFQPEDAYQALSRAYELLDAFQGPPFTIQRLCELAISPRKHYTSLPKYFRALTRVISVTSDRATFTEEDDLESPIASTSGPPPVTHSSVILAGATIPTRRPAAGRSPMSSPKAVPVVVPLLSPIPWLVHKDDDMDSVDSMNLSSTSSPNPKSHPALSPPSTKRSSPVKTDTPIPQSSTATPTGGLVDEVDPGSGTQEITDPLALTHATPLSPPTPSNSLEVTTLAERFVRASSPRVEREPPEKAEEGKDEVGNMEADV